MKNEILKLLENDARLTDKQLAVMMDTDEAEIRREINELEKSGTILAYKTIIDWEKTENESVTAMIDVKLTPQKERGFDRVAEKIYNYPEVQAVYLMS
jgi:DNA-binding Lrp family transcriptional regulator